MSKPLILALSLVLLVGCTTPNGEPPFSFLPAGESVLAPQTLPFATVLSPEVSADSMKVVEPEKRVLKTTTEWDDYVLNLTRRTGSALSIPRPDLTRRTAIVFSETGLYRLSSARIVGVEEQPDRLVVHTVRWESPAASAFLNDPHTAMHIVAVPRSEKPIVFAHTLTVPLMPGAPVPPSPAVGQQPLAFTTDERPIDYPRWRLVPNPDVTKETVETGLRAQLGADRLETLNVEKQSLAWVRQNLEIDGPESYLPESEVWVAIATGKFEIQIPQTGKPSLGAPVRTVTMLLSIEDGRAFSTVWR